MISATNRTESSEVEAISKCIRHDLNIPTSPSIRHYTTPLSVQDSLERHFHEEEEEQIRKLRLHLSASPSSTAVRPEPSRLRSKYSVKCRDCSEKGFPGILLKPQIQPLLGDSSL